MIFTPLLPALANLRRMLLHWHGGHSHASEVLETAIRLRMMMGSGSLPEYEPRFWVAVELDTMPERRMMNIAVAYRDLIRSGLEPEAVFERLEIWRSRFSEANLKGRHASLAAYLHYRMRIECPPLGKLPMLYFRLAARLFLRHAEYREQQRNNLLAHVTPALKRLLYTVRVNGPDIALEDSEQTLSIGWTDLERYLESDSIAVRVLDGDEIWSYSSKRSAGLALVRAGRAVEVSELANFRGRHPKRKRSNGTA